MYTSFVKYLLNPSSLSIDVPISFVTQFYGNDWSDRKMRIYHSSGKIWVVMLKRVKCMPVLTDGWQTVVSDLKVQKDCLLTFRPMNHFGLYLSPYVNGVCDQSYFTINRHLRLGFTVEIRLSKKVESDDDDDVFQISKADYLKTLFKDIEDDDNQPTPDESPLVTVPSRTPKKVQS
ncbi:putative transcription factor B3-Domain family [Helianthus debilis subsp. tardiflorus]